MNKPTLIFISMAIVLFAACQSGENCDKPITTDTTTNQKVSIKSDSPAIQQAEPSRIKVPETCYSLASRIMTSSPAFIELTKGLSEAVEKNGGTSFGVMLEGSPNPESDETLYSETYDFNLHESYPDHMAVIARFSFNPITRQLYKCDILGDTLLIDFDKRLLSEFDELCK